MFGNVLRPYGTYFRFALLLFLLFYLAILTSFGSPVHRLSKAKNLSRNSRVLTKPAVDNLCRIFATTYGSNGIVSNGGNVRVGEVIRVEAEYINTSYNDCYSVLLSVKAVEGLTYLADYNGSFQAQTERLSNFNQGQIVRRTYYFEVINIGTVSFELVANQDNCVNGNYVASFRGICRTCKPDGGCNPINSPSVEVIPSSMSITSGQTVTLKATGCAYGVDWGDGSARTPSASATTPLYKAEVLSANKTYSISCVDFTCTSNAEVKTITVKSPIPNAPTLTASPSGAICPGEKVTITAAGCEGGTVDWGESSQNTRISSIQSESHDYNPYESTKYKVACKVNGVRGPESEIVVTIKSSASITQISPSYNCGNRTALLTVFSSGDPNGNFYAYAWAGNGSYPNGADRRQYQANSDGMYSVTVTDPGNNVCPAKRDIFVNISQNCTSTTPDFVSNLEDGNCEIGFKGWALNRNDKNQSLTLTITVDGQISSTFQANASRNDVRDNHNPGSSFTNYGFIWPIPSQYQDGLLHKYRITFPNGDLLVERSLVCGISPCPGLSISPSDQTISTGQSITWTVSGTAGPIIWKIDNVPQPENGTTLTRSFGSERTYPIVATLANQVGCQVQTTVKVQNTNVPPVYEGVLDTPQANWDCGSLWGWVIDRNHFGQSMLISIKVDGQLYSLTADVERCDVKDAMVNRGLNPGNFCQYGFHWTVPAQYKNGQNHTFQILYPDGTVLSERTQTCGTPPACPGLSISPNATNLKLNQEGTWVLNGSNGPVTWKVNGQTQSEPSTTFRYTFTTQGSYTITAVLTNQSQCQIQAQVTVTNESQPKNYISNVESKDCNGIGGWALDRNALGQSLELIVEVDGQTYGSVIANGQRCDVRDAYQPGSGFCSYGFNWSIPNELKNGQPHSYRLKYPDGTALTGQPFTFTCGTPPPPASVSLQIRKIENNAPGTVLYTITDGMSIPRSVLVSNAPVDLYIQVTGGHNKVLLKPTPPDNLESGWGPEGVEQSNGKIYGWHGQAGPYNFTTGTYRVKRAAYQDNTVVAGSADQQISFIVIDVTCTVSITPSSTTITSGQSVTLTAQNIPAGASLSWSSGQGNQSAITVSPTTTTTYSVSASQPTGCMTQATVTVVPPPPATIALQIRKIENNAPGTVLYTITEGMSIPRSALVTNAPVGLYIQVTGPHNKVYLWHTSPTNVETGWGPESIPQSSAGVYGLNGQAGSYTFNAGTHRVKRAAYQDNTVVAGSPDQQVSFIVIDVTCTVSITPSSTTITSGQSVTLTAQNIPAGASLSWSSGQGNQSAITVSPTTTTTYSVSASQPTGCMTQATVTVVPPPPATIALQIRKIENNAPGTVLYTITEGMSIPRSALVTNAPVGLYIQVTGPHNKVYLWHTSPTNVETGWGPESIPQSSAGVYGLNGQAGSYTFNAGTHRVKRAAYQDNTVVAGSPDQQVSFIVTDVTCTVSITPSSMTITSGQSVTLTAQNIPAGASLSWSSGQGNQSAITVSPTTTTTYSVSASQPTGCLAQAIVTVQTASTSCSGTGQISYERWNSITGSTIAELTGNSRFQSGTPDVTQLLTSFDAPRDIADNYGVRMRGYLCPPQTGAYTFWVAGDDNVDLYLSTTDQPANKVRIAYHTVWSGYLEWEKYATQKSSTITLQAGQKYYIEALLKEGEGGDNLSVGWQLPNSTLERPIPGSRLIPFTTTVPCSVSLAVTSTTLTAGQSVTLTASGNSGPYVWQQNGSNQSETGTTLIRSLSTVGSYTFVVAPSTQSGCTQTQVVTVLAPSTCSATGQITYERWNAITGSTIADLTGNSRFQSGTPDVTQLLTIFDAPRDVTDNYGARIRGYICPPQTGVYTFWVAGDDNVDLYLSTTDLPTNKVKIAYHTGFTGYQEWEKFPTQKSASITLQAGQRYYIEALLKDNNYGDNLSVGWQLPNGTLERPIAGSRLSPYSSTSCTTSLNPSSTTITTGQSVTLTASGSSGPFVWKQNGSNQAETGATLVRTLSTAGSYTFTVAPSSQTVCSQTTVVTVTNSSVITLQLREVVVDGQGNKSVSPTVLYTITDGMTIPRTALEGKLINLYIQVSGDHNQVMLRPLAPGNPESGWGPENVTRATTGLYGWLAQTGSFIPQLGAYQAKRAAYLNGSLVAGSETIPVNFTITGDPCNLVVTGQAKANGVEMTVTGGTPTAGGSSTANQGISFDGTNDRLQTAFDAFSNLSGTFTWEAWVKPQKVLSGDRYSGQQYLLSPTYSGGTSLSTHAGMGVAVGTNGIKVYEHTANYMPERIVYTASITNWIHVAVVYTSNASSLYVNGQLVGSATTSTKIVHPSIEVGGGTHSSYGYMQGIADEVRVWNRARTVTEILTDYQNVLQGNENGLVSYWRFEEASGTAITNLVASGPTATMTNGPVRTTGAPLILPSTGANYVWRGPNGYSGTGNPITVTEGGTYSVQCTNCVSICTQTANVTLPNSTTGCEPTCSPLPSGTISVTPNPAAGQTVNLVAENTYLTDQTNATSSTHLNQTITYLDGLGRPLQQVTTKGSPNQRDWVQPMAYDVYGREENKYLPYEGSGTGGTYVSLAINDVAATYLAIKGDNKPFAKTVFENSPLNRVTKQGAPGSPWQPDGGKAVGSNYRSNNAGEVRLFTVSGTSASSGGAYGAGELAVTETTDEANNVTIEFTDKNGRVVCRKQVGVSVRENGSESNRDLITQYVYDEMGRLRFVLPPLLSDATTVSATDPIAFYYQYDARGRLIQKSVPGAGQTSLYYNQRDELVLTKDANNKMVFTKYDAWGRPVITGLYTGTADASTINAASSLYESISGGNYSNTAFPTANTDILTVTYYDNYDFVGTSGRASRYAFTTLSGYAGSQNTSLLKNRVTGQKVKVLNRPPGESGWENWLYTVNYYDEDGRVVQSIADHHRTGSFTRVTNSYSFAGWLLKSVSQQYFPDGSHPVTVHQQNSYDHSGRLVGHYQTIAETATAQMTRIAGQSYNALGELVQKQLGCGPIQRIDYAYNMRGWLVSLNDLNLPPTSGTTPGDLFGMKLAYTDNGNISQQQWKSASRSTTYQYAYQYDAASRLREATFAPNGEFAVSGMRYDRNGNLQTMQRQLGAGGLADNLTYTYDGTSKNRLTKVDDAGDSQKGFINQANTDYAYDAVGNLTQDANKNLTTIQSNHLNLPELLQFSASKSIRYNYDALGRKLRKVVVDGGTTVTDYVGGNVYQEGELQFLPTAEGRAIPKSLVPNQTGTGFVYEYHLKDHLGSTRVAVRQNCGQVVVVSATMEPPAAEREEAQFEGVAEHRKAGEAYQGRYAARLRGETGPSTELAVREGDEIRAKVWAYIEPRERTRRGWGLLPVLSRESSGGGDPLVVGPRKWRLKGALPISWLRRSEVNRKKVPEAYLRVETYDSDHKLISQQRQAIDKAAKEGWQELSLAVKAPKAGYVSVSVANENRQQDALFDNLRVESEEPVIVQENHYDPWGMSLDGLNLKQDPITYKFQFNGKEKQEELALQWYDYGARMYSPEIGRWMVVDPSSENSLPFSPYNYVANDPVQNIDPDGRDYLDGTQGEYKRKDGSVETYDATGRTVKVTRFEGGDGPGKGKSAISGKSLTAINLPGHGIRKNGSGDLEAFSTEAANTVPNDEFIDPTVALIDFLYGTNFSGSKSSLVEDSNGQLVYASSPSFGGLKGGAGKGEFDAVGAFKNAISRFKGGNLTNAGRAVTKHPEYFGFESTEALMKVYRNPKALNNLGSTLLKDILRNGVKTTGAGGRYPNGWATYTLPNGNAASWGLDGTFIGFRGIK